MGYIRFGTSSHSTHSSATRILMDSLIIKGSLSFHRHMIPFNFIVSTDIDETTENTLLNISLFNVKLKWNEQ